METIRDFQRNNWRKTFNRINAMRSPWIEDLLAAIGGAGMTVVISYMLMMIFEVI